MFEPKLFKVAVWCKSNTYRAERDGVTLLEVEGRPYDVQKKYLVRGLSPLDAMDKAVKHIQNTDKKLYPFDAQAELAGDIEDFLS